MVLWQVCWFQNFVSFQENYHIHSHFYFFLWFLRYDHNKDLDYYDLEFIKDALLTQVRVWRLKKKKSMKISNSRFLGSVPLDNRKRTKILFSALNIRYKLFPLFGCCVCSSWQTKCVSKKLSFVFGRRGRHWK